MPKINNVKNEEEIFQEFFIATKSPKFKGEFVVYASDPFKLSEIDIINLIKICIMEARSKAIGKKILAIYEDSTDYRKEITKQRLKYIGIEPDEKPTRTNRKSPTIK
jgi:hypothetical protein